MKLNITLIEAPTFGALVVNKSGEMVIGRGFPVQLHEVRELQNQFCEEAGMCIGSIHAGDVAGMIEHDINVREMFAAPELKILDIRAQNVETNLAALIRRSQ